MQASQGGREEESKAYLKKKLMGKPEMTTGQKWRQEGAKVILR